MELNNTQCSFKSDRTAGTRLRSADGFRGRTATSTGRPPTSDLCMYLILASCNEHSPLHIPLTLGPNEAERKGDGVKGSRPDSAVGRRMTDSCLWWRSGFGGRPPTDGVRGEVVRRRRCCLNVRFVSAGLCFQFVEVVQ